MWTEELSFLSILSLYITCIQSFSLASTSTFSVQPKIIYQNNFLVAIDKPAGLSFHSEFEAGAVQLTRDILGEGEEVYPVHRIDKTT